MNKTRLRALGRTSSPSRETGAGGPSSSQGRCGSPPAESHLAHRAVDSVGRRTPRPSSFPALAGRSPSRSSRPSSFRPSKGGPSARVRDAPVRRNGPLRDVHGGSAGTSSIPKPSAATTCPRGPQASADRHGGRVGPDDVRDGRLRPRDARVLRRVRPVNHRGRPGTCTEDAYVPMTRHGIVKILGTRTSSSCPRAAVLPQGARLPPPEGAPHLSEARGGAALVHPP